MAKQRKRAKRGTGSVFQRGDGKWVARKPLGRAAGRTRYVERVGDTMAEAINRRDAAAPPGPKTTVAEWCDRWLATITVRPLTRDGYTSSVTHRIRPELGSRVVAKLTAFEIEAAIKKWEARVGANTIRLTLSHLRIALGAAVRAGLIATNPVCAANKPRSVREKVEYYTPDELKRLIAAGCAEPKWGAVALLAALGMRRGELLALDVTDFDPRANTISITKGDIGKHGIGPPKSPHSVRTLEVPDAALPAVRVAVAGRASGPMFRTATGARLDENTLAERLKAATKSVGIPYRSLHKLRHGVATGMNARGYPLGDLATFLGDTPATVARRYVHATGARAVAVLNAMYGGRRVEEAPAETPMEPKKQGRRRAAS